MSFSVSFTLPCRIVHWAAVLLIPLAVASCKSRSFHRVSSDDAGVQSISVPTAFAAVYRPVGTWTGRLVLPSPAERKPDGGVWIVLDNAPDENLRGQKVWLTFNSDPDVQRWEKAVRNNLNLSEDARKQLSQGLVLAARLDGWKQVSLLESLAGARAQDNMDVLLKDAQFADGQIVVGTEPVQICGAVKALVQFEGSGGAGIRKVRYFDPQSGNFSDKTGTVRIPEFQPSPRPADKHVDRSSTVDIEASLLNSDGWYIYGRWQNDAVFTVEALEPRKLLSLQQTRFIVGKTASHSFVANDNFKGLTHGLARSTLLRAAESDSYLVNPENASNVALAHYQLGTKGLLVHLFGSHSHPEDTPSGRVAGITTGHFSFGFFEVVTDSITGEKRFDIEYKQIYAHNRDGIISGSTKWHNYMGNLQRGWMYSTPVTDALLSTAMLNPYQLGNSTFDPMVGLDRSLVQMSARYRIGGGKGISTIQPWRSCVQDSYNALHAALREFNEGVLQSDKINAWRQANANSNDNTRLKMLENFVKQVEEHVTTMGMAQADWRLNAENPAGYRDTNIVPGILSALMSWKTVLPRAGFDRFLESSIDGDVGAIWVLQSALIGGKQDPQIVPLAPTTPLRN